LLETPVGRVRVFLHPCVYEPAEDSMLAIRVAVELVERSGSKPQLLLDAGSGSGVIGASLARVYGSFVVAVDINPYAVAASAKTLNGMGVAIRCDWAKCLRSVFDLAILNPPYLPVKDDYEKCPYLPLSWGSLPGELERACRSVARVARRIVLVYSSLSGWDPGKCLEDMGFNIIVSREEAFFMERIIAVGAVRGNAGWTG
jgi:release factor glutamine methyltransferase